MSNCTVSLVELTDWTVRRQLVPNSVHVPLGEFGGAHRYVSFVDPTHFKLHSDASDTHVVQPSDQLGAVLRSYRRTSMEEDITTVPQALSDHRRFSRIFAQRGGSDLKRSVEDQWRGLCLTLWDVLGIRWRKIPELA